MKEIPRYLEIAQSLARPIETGTLNVGDKLPSVRLIAREHGVSVMTALQAIRTLEDAGKIVSRPRSGFYVAPQTHSLEEQDSQVLDLLPLDAPESLHLSIVGSPCRVRLDLANGDTSLYPIDRLSVLMRQLIYRSPQLLGAPVHDHKGYEPLRHQIARRALDYGCVLNTQEIIITNGCIEALSLALRAVTAPGDNVAVESPTYFVILQMLRNLGRNLIPVSVTDDGMDLNELQTILHTHKVKAVISIANANNPVGCITSDEHKRRLVELIDEHKIPLIEDDIYGDTQYSTIRPKPIRAFSDKIILCSSFSKTLAPGIRVGWVAAGKWASTIAALKYTSTMGTPIYPQATIAEFLRSGAYDAHLRKLRRTLKFQVERMRECIILNFPPGTKVSRAQGGYVLWVQLPDKTINTRRIFELARNEGIGIAPGCLFTRDDQFDNCFRLNGGFGWNKNVEDSIKKLSAIVENLMQ